MTAQHKQTNTGSATFTDKYRAHRVRLQKRITLVGRYHATSIALTLLVIAATALDWFLQPEGLWLLLAIFFALNITTIINSFGVFGMIDYLSDSRSLLEQEWHDVHEASPGTDVSHRGMLYELYYSPDHQQVATYCMPLYRLISFLPQALVMLMYAVVIGELDTDAIELYIVPVFLTNCLIYVMAAMGNYWMITGPKEFKV